MRPVYLLDTCVVSEPAKSRPSEPLLAALARHEGICAIPSIVLHELSYGIERLPDGKKRERLFAYLNEVVRPFLPVIPYDEHAALVHAEIRAEAERREDETRGSRVPPFTDGQIAAIAIANNLVLVTRNVEDYKGIYRLMIEDWFSGER